MKRTGLVVATLVAVVVLFVVGALLYRAASGPAASAVQLAQAEALVRPHAPVVGNPSAKVTIVEFFDPACGTCRAFYPIVKDMVRASGGQVRLVLRYAPLHQGSDRVIKIIEAARLQGLHASVMEAVLASQEVWAAHHDPQPDRVWELITATGLDIERARRDVGSAEIERIVWQDRADMVTLKVDKTPGFFVNGRPLEPFGVAPLKALVEDERRRAYPG